MKLYLGIDVGSVSTNLVVIDENKKVIEALYLRNHGDVIKSVQNGLSKLKSKEKDICGVATTGSGRFLIQKLVGADIAKNEITCHATAAIFEHPEAKTVLEIGGQDSKIILVRNQTAVDFNMNTVCAAGTGSFLDQQAQRLGIPIEDFGKTSKLSKKPASIRGRCTVFAESDMISKQQLGYKKPDIIKGLCEAMVRNYLNNVAKGRDLDEPIIFQGGVAANSGIKDAFEKILGKKIIISKHFGVMGALGAALIVKKAYFEKEIEQTKFKGFKVAKHKFSTDSFVCKACSNNCEITRIIEDKKVIAHLGSMCGKWV